MSGAPPRRPPRFTPFLVLAHDLALAAVAIVGVLLVRYHFEHKPPPDHLVSRSTGVFVVICALVFVAFRQHRTMWRFTTLNEVLRLAEAVVAADLLLLPALFVLDRAQDFPRSTPVLLAPVLIALLAFGRVLAHLLRAAQQPGAQGAGEEARQRRAYRTVPHL